MATLTPVDLLAQLKSLVANPPSELTANATLRNELATAARNVFLTLEKPEDVVARILLSQVRSKCPSFNPNYFQIIFRSLSLSVACRRRYSTDCDRPEIVLYAQRRRANSGSVGASY